MCVHQKGENKQNDDYSLASVWRDRNKQEETEEGEWVALYLEQ